ncbi:MULTISPECIES: methionine ABC transporter ATP-binding protein [Enterococcus]|uniref:methionine ABC transporter ATP-binding protein n=1 Tax=Enterococcus TaxID=1350 RepID=UPI0001CEADE1|nr:MULTISPECIES: ATP-binding cassette domain-containing protein [Enterococcus]EFF37204.1 methionine import ATP-binding protein MetN 1 [Enterococcus faecium E980]EGP4902520.1 ATP-binding cassette domain-containing protein [Enterococcus faecium]EGP4969989.1 ATP-binding cassette domain-containing protein [Enterococcus faecium]EGP5121882.1 ATP-binding cassette domain-containing protein [Enterococcus faecium]EGP5233096.1 ATP-binding cassette domain-containing protein [Enterococcus faecium]
MTEKIIELKDVVVDFYHDRQLRRALDHVDLTVCTGEIFGIVGYSGAGKSTLVRLINYLQQPSSGEIIVNDQNLATLNNQGLQKARQKIGMIFQHFNLMKSRTVINNVEFPLLSKKISANERREKAMELLDLVGLSDYAEVYPDQLSGGQKQRVAIARALANEPDILISDESTSALDPKTTVSILKLLQELNRKLNLTIVLITHEMQVIQTICHKVAVMEKGKVIEQGSVSEIFTQPKQSLTQEFIDTASNVREALSRIRSTYDERNKQPLYLLKFVGETTNQAVVTDMAQQFHLSASILFANVDQINQLTIGVLVLALAGEKDQILSGIGFLEKQGVQVTRVFQEQEMVA